MELFIKAMVTYIEENQVYIDANAFEYALKLMYLLRNARLGWHTDIEVIETCTWELWLMLLLNILSRH
jgi:hypothetical protein